MLLQPGQIFANDFRIVRNLSAGGMGSVFVVEQLSTGNQRALKLMHPQLVADPRLRERFLQEARVGSKIASDHVVQVLSAGIEPNTNVPWLVMELLQGEELRKRVDRAGPIPWLEASEIGRQLNHALSAAHRVGIVHRDLKPDNLFLGESRVSGTPFTLKVLDFGIAKVLAEAQTTGTSGLGTPLWMAPEQAELKSQIDARTDIWAVGLIFFYVLTGKFFWASANVEAPSLHGLMRELLIEPIIPASARAGERGQAPLLPPGFDGWFARCVDRDVARRFANVDEAFGSLLAILSSGAAHRSAVAPMQVAPMQHGQSGRQGPAGLTGPAPMALSNPVPPSLHQSYPAPPIPLHGYQQPPHHAHPSKVDRSHPGAGLTEHAPPVMAVHGPPPVARPNAQGSRRGLVLGLTLGALALGGAGVTAWLVTREPATDDRRRRKRRRSSDDDTEEETEETSPPAHTLEADCQTLAAVVSRHSSLNTIDWSDERELATGLPLLDALVADLRVVPLSSGELKANVDEIARHIDEMSAGARNALAAKQRGDDRSAQAYALDLMRADKAMKASSAKIAMLCPEEPSN